MTHRRAQERTFSHRPNGVSGDGVRRGRLLAAAAAIALAGCVRDAPARPSAVPDAACLVVAKGLTLPDELKETSGVVESRRHPGVYWTHNDSGHSSHVFAVGIDGRALGMVRVQGARNHDWEDIAAGPCPDGAAPSCLYIADTGNNAERENEREPKTVTLWVFPEPEPRDASTAPAREYRARFPGEPTDIEALVVLPDGSVYLVSKGNHAPVELFRWPTPLETHGKPTLDLVRRLAPEPTQLGDRVTGASASPDGRFVAVRTYAALAFYRTPDLLGSGRPFAQLDLDPLAEPQGEAVSLADDGNVVLTSEGPGKHLPGTLAYLRCTLPR